MRVGGKLEVFCLWGGDCEWSPSVGSAGNWKRLLWEQHEGGPGSGDGRGASTLLLFLLLCAGLFPGFKAE